MEPLASAPLASWELEEWRRVAMVILILLPEGIWEGGHDPCPSSLEKWKSAVMAKPIPPLEGGKDAIVNAPLLLRTRGVEECVDDHPRLSMTSALLLLRSGGVWSWLPPCLF